MTKLTKEESGTGDGRHSALLALMGEHASVGKCKVLLFMFSKGRARGTGRSCSGARGGQLYDNTNYRHGGR